MNTVVWFEIYVSDMNRAKKFYEAVFMKKLEPLTNEATVAQNIEMYAFPGDMNASGANGSLVKMPGFQAGQNSVLVYFGCEDCAVEEDRVVKNGGKVMTKKMSIGQYGFISLVYDTENNMIGLHSMK